MVLNSVAPRAPNGCADVLPRSICHHAVEGSVLSNSAGVLRAADLFRV